MRPAAVRRTISNRLSGGRSKETCGRSWTFIVQLGRASWAQVEEARRGLSGLDLARRLRTAFTGGVGATHRITAATLQRNIAIAARAHRRAVSGPCGADRDGALKVGDPRW